MAAEPSTVPPLPTELLLSILSYLPFHDIRTFSTCSKAFRSTSLALVFRNLKFSHPASTSIADIRRAFEDPQHGSLHHICGRVRHVTLHSHNIKGLEEIVTYFRTRVALLPLFPGLTSLMITRAGLYPHMLGWLEGFDDSIISAIWRMLEEAWPGRHTLLRKVAFKTLDYVHQDRLRGQELSVESLRFLGWDGYYNSQKQQRAGEAGGSITADGYGDRNRGEDEDEDYEERDEVEETGANKHAIGLGHIYPCPAPIEEAYINRDYVTSRQRIIERPIPDLLYLANCRQSLKTVGIWINTFNGNMTPQWAATPAEDYLAFYNVRDLRINMGFFMQSFPEQYLDELARRFPKVEKVVIYHDYRCHEYIEGERMYRYGSLMKLWPKTLKEARLPWLTYFGSSYETRSMGATINVWIDEHSLNKLKRVVFVREIVQEESGFDMPDELEAIGCDVVIEGEDEGRWEDEVKDEYKLRSSDRKLVWGGLYRIPQLELDGYVVPR
ncbi:hypothetical protein H072_9318 [Dactylellina haptotyla CBS 200.50]|uniref:F-box domain-containing protein n=1 Tax=Dactylellina haptotyla (strain CBS 200.50) TaxID=1284197 RepID=S8A7G2_DACHA|nr:hypothetical protein H072_9318 [Dactylellina haptotyla CBS 200.50]